MAFAVVLVCVSVLVNCSFGAGKIKEYSAEQVTVTPDGKVKDVVKFYVKTQKIRMEPSTHKKKDSPVIIFRQDLNVVRILNPEEKKYIENALNEAELAQTMRKIPENIKQEDLGTEKVNGFVCQKKRIEVTTKFFGREKKSRSIVWISDRLDFTVKTQSEDNQVTELRNIKQGEQPDNLFEVPAGYSRMKMFDPAEGVRSKLPKGLKLPFGK